jgi:hypothetical protein
MKEYDIDKYWCPPVDGYLDKYKLYRELERSGWEIVDRGMDHGAISYKFSHSKYGHFEFVGLPEREASKLSWKPLFKWLNEVINPDPLEEIIDTLFDVDADLNANRDHLRKALERAKAMGASEASRESHDQGFPMR